MSQICRFVFFAILIFLSAGKTQAQLHPFYPWDNIYTWRDGGKVTLDEIADAQSLLGTEKYVRYKNYLNSGNCEPAYRLLTQAFISRYPKFAGISEEGRDAKIEWRQSFVAEKYRDMHFCNFVKRIEGFNFEYRTTPDLIGFYYHRQRRNKGNPTWLIRDLAIEDLYVLIDREHLPALIYIADLAANGTIFENSAEVEYFMLARACANNIRCSEIKGRINILENELPEKSRIKLKDDAENPFKTLRDHFPGYEKPTE
jgi:hypothetical protein